MGGSYQQGWDDCLDAVLSILQKAKDLKEATNVLRMYNVNDSLELCCCPSAINENCLSSNVV